jgi:predicted nucleic acid-binding protein
MPTATTLIGGRIASHMRSRNGPTTTTSRTSTSRCIFLICASNTRSSTGAAIISALIYELARASLIEAWVSPAILEEYADVLGDHPEFVAEVVETFPVRYPLSELSVIRHEPDSRFLECALAADVEFIVTVNTAPGHFDRKQYQSVKVTRPSEFLNGPEVARLVQKLIRD